MRKVDDGEKKRKEEEEKNDVYSGHYVIASSLPPERLRPNDDRWNAARSCQFVSWCLDHLSFFNFFSTKGGGRSDA